MASASFHIHDSLCVCVFICYTQFIVSVCVPPQVCPPASSSRHTWWWWAHGSACGRHTCTLEASTSSIHSIRNCQSDHKNLNRGGTADTWCFYQCHHQIRSTAKNQSYNILKINIVFCSDSDEKLEWCIDALIQYLCWYCLIKGYRSNVTDPQCNFPNVLKQYKLNQRLS